MSTVKSTAINIEIAPHEKDFTVLTTAADVIATLPRSSHATMGAKVRLVVGVVSTGTGAQINPHAGDTIHGHGVTAAADKNLINTGASDALGDLAELTSDGAGSWWITGLIGTWAREA